MDKQTQMTKELINELDKINRIRHYQRLPVINYDPLEVERLCDLAKGIGNKKIIINLVIEKYKIGR